MTNTFIFSKGYLVEKPEMQIPIPPRGEDVQNKYREFNDSMSEYDKYIATLRRFKYDYPDPKKDMELGKDFKVKRGKQIFETDQQQWQEMSPKEKDECFEMVAVPIKIDYWKYRCLLAERLMLSLSSNGYMIWDEDIKKEWEEAKVAIPITQRTFSEQDLLDTWDAAEEYGKEFLSSNIRFPNKQQFLKTRFGIEIKQPISLKIDFSKDWNKIMPVAKRIIDMDLEIKRPLSVEYLSMREKLIWALIDVSIEKIHEHCVKFIQWYNNQQKQVKE